MLDDEYAEKYPPEQSVTWSSDLAGEDITVTARDYCGSVNDDGSTVYFLDLEFHEVFTPEQAIDATLGRGATTRTGKYRTKYGRRIPVCERCGYGIGDMRWHYCPSCGAEVVDV